MDVPMASLLPTATNTSDAPSKVEFGKVTTAHGRIKIRGVVGMLRVS